MQEEKISNYVKLCMEWADKFMQMDRQDLLRRVPELKEEKGYLTGQNEVTTDVVWVQEKLSANSVAVRMESRALFVMARV